MKIKILYLGLLALLFNCNKKQAENEAEKKNDSPISNEVPYDLVKNSGIVTNILQNRPVKTLIKLNGKIDVPPQNLVSVSVPLGGYLKSTKLLPGMYVKKGEVIATIEDQQFIQLQQDYLLTKEKLELTQLEYLRQKELNSNQAGSTKILQQSLFELNNAKINLISIGEKLKLLGLAPNLLTADKINGTINIRSKISGFVSKINVNIGKYLNPSDVLFELIDPNDLHLNLKVFEKDIPKLYLGQRLLAYNNQNPAEKYQCEIILISKDISDDGFIEVHCHFKNHSSKLLPGMYMNAELEFNNKNVATINEEAIVNFEGKNFLFIKKPNQNFGMEEVIIGEKTDQYYEVKNYEKYKNTEIVTKGAYTLLMTLKNKEEE